MSDRRAAADVGRRARLELVFASRGGRTVLADAYAEPPLRVGRVFPEGGGLHMILVSSAPGIFGGDRFEQVIRVEPGARVRLTSQSALQIHPAADAARACLFTTYHVADGATLRCHWDPMIPFAGARFEQRIDVRLTGEARLDWSDGFMAGRAFCQPRSGAVGAIGERWSFDLLAHELRVTRGDLLEYLERFRIVPAERPVTDRWTGGEAAYFGTTLRSGFEVTAAAAERLQHELNANESLHAAVDLLSPTLRVARLTSTNGVPFHAAREGLARAGRQD